MRASGSLRAPLSSLSKKLEVCAQPHTAILDAPVGEKGREFEEELWARGWSSPHGSSNC